MPVTALGDDAAAGQGSATVRTRVEAARARQHARLGARIAVNAHIPGREVRKLCRIGPAGRAECAGDETRARGSLPTLRTRRPQ